MTDHDLVNFPTILLCMDMDRTVIPNGSQPESPNARPALRRLAERPEILIAYITGRRRDLIQSAVEEYDLPQPDFAAGDVGSSVYQVKGSEWMEMPDWLAMLEESWGGKDGDDIRRLWRPMDEIELQEPEAQGRFKVSFYTPDKVDRHELFRQVREQLGRMAVEANLIWSVDEAEGKGLLDILPPNADKAHALKFLTRHVGVPRDRAIFAGDSGNDLPALLSGHPAILTRNASEEVREEARRRAEELGIISNLYFAEGDSQKENLRARGETGLNGNYAGGVLEGLIHFYPHIKGWIIDN